jgi:ElaB/YqjD/DUF883 family membrane-anchored ribosome-binding protein
LWEGEIAEPVEYNRFIGDIKIDGSSFEYGMITVGSVIECNYTFSDSGNVDIKISVPSVGITLDGKNFYNRLSGQINFQNDADKIVDDANEVLEMIDEISGNIYDDKLDTLKEKIGAYVEKDTLDAEDAQALFEFTQEAKKTVASFMRENKQVVWQQKLDSALDTFESLASQATAAQKQQVEKLKVSIQSAIDANSETAEKLIDELEKINGKILTSDISFVFAVMREHPEMFTNPALYRQLIAQGMQALARGDQGELREVVARLAQIMVRREGSELDTILRTSGITK